MLELTLTERLETEVARLLAGMPRPLARRIAGAPVRIDGRELDPHVQVLLRARTLMKKKGTSKLDVRVARREIEVAANQLAHHPPPALASVESAVIGGRPARIYVPCEVPRPTRALVWFHGGGFVVGSLDSHDVSCRQIAAQTPCVVIAVDYRLAPEHPFPAAADDATAAFRDVVERAEGLGLDASRVGVGGDSAGGNLACIVGLDTRNDLVRPRVLLVVYPAIDFTMSFPSHASLGRGFFLEDDDIRHYRRTYLAGESERHPRASPWFADDVSGLPPSIVLTAGFDPLRDEGDAWAGRLQRAGIEVDHLPAPTLFHGFWNCGGKLASAAAAVEAGLSALRTRL